MDYSIGNLLIFGMWYSSTEHFNFFFQSDLILSFEKSGVLEAPTLLYLDLYVVLCSVVSVL